MAPKKATKAATKTKTAKKTKSGSNAKWNNWAKAVQEARKEMVKKYPNDFKGFIAIRSSDKCVGVASKENKRKIEMGHMWYLKAREMYDQTKKC